jgi:hypothetical protein
VACNYTRSEIAEIVLDVLRDLHGDPTITEASRFAPNDINVDELTKRLYYYPIKITVETSTCTLKTFSPAKCKAAKKVGDIVSAVWQDVK